MDSSDRAVQLAKVWHDHYVKVAPSYGYAESEWSVPWQKLDEKAQRCLVAVARRMLTEMDNARIHNLLYP